MSDSIYNVNLTINADFMPQFAEFCATYSVKYDTTAYDLGNPMEGWRIFSKAESNTLVDNHNAVIPKFNHTGLYWISYGEARSPLSKNIFYIGESSCPYTKKTQTGALMRLNKAVVDFKPGMRSNHNDKFFNKREEIARRYGDDEFDIYKLRFAVRPHEAIGALSKPYSLKMEAKLIQEYKKKHGMIPFCNTNGQVVTAA